MTKKKIQLPIIPIVIGIVVVAALLLLLGGNSGKDAADEEIRKGLAYLQSLEEKDPADVQQVRKALRQRELNEQRDELLEKLTSGNIDPFSLFQDYVVMGDSRAVGFWYRNFLDKGRVLADGGHTIRNIPDQIDTLVTLNPSTIYLCYGLNDCSIGYWDSAESYVAEYVQVVKAIRYGQERPASAHQPSVIIRSKKKGERLWDIAKKHGSTVSAITRINDLKSEPEDGQLLLIPVL